jgi:hypothetical protein
VPSTAINRLIKVNGDLSRKYLPSWVTNMHHCIVMQSVDFRARPLAFGGEALGLLFAAPGGAQISIFPRARIIFLELSSHENTLHFIRSPCLARSNQQGFLITKSGTILNTRKKGYGR